MSTRFDIGEDSEDMRAKELFVKDRSDSRGWSDVDPDDKDIRRGGSGIDDTSSSSSSALSAAMSEMSEKNDQAEEMAADPTLIHQLLERMGHVLEGTSISHRSENSVVALLRVTIHRAQLL